MSALDNLSGSAIDTEPVEGAFHSGHLVEQASPDRGEAGRPISSLHAGIDRWRYPSWPEVCQVADRARRRRDREHPPVVRITAEPAGSSLRVGRRIRRYGPGARL